MLRYETLMLAIPEITKDEMSSLESQVEQAIKKLKGSVISFERWGKYRLAYPVRKNEYGVYFLMRFEVGQDHSKTIAHDLNDLFAFKKADVIMRSMTTALSPHQSLIYQKPESLEDTPSRDVDSFLRENKMEGLLSKDHEGSRSSAAAQAYGAKEILEEDDLDDEDEE